MANDRRFIDIAEAIENLETQILACEPADETEPLVNRIVKACVPKLLRNTVDWLNARPVVDAVEVVHGRWVWKETGEEEYEMYWVCSKCGDHTYFETNYCPNCGAKMDGDGND